MMTADYCTSEASPQCTLDLRVYEDDTTPIAYRVNSQLQINNAKKLRKPGKLVLTTGSKVAVSPSHQSVSHCVQTKQVPHSHRYVSKLTADTVHKDVEVVDEDGVVDENDNGTSSASLLDGDDDSDNEDDARRWNNRCRRSLPKTTSSPSHDTTEASSATAKARLNTKSSCYMLSRSQWERYRQKYRAEWENDPLFQGWIAPVSGDVHKARCLYCRAMVRAHYKDLKVHARTAKHAHNVAVNQPGCIADPETPAAKPLLNRRRTFGPQRTTRFDPLHKTDPLTAADVNADDAEKEPGGLLAPDDSLASHASLVSMAIYPSGQPIPRNVTTLVMSNTMSLDETIGSTLWPTAPDGDTAMYRVKKLHPSSTNDISYQHRDGSSNDDANSMPSLYRAARGITLWEFLRLKVREDSDRPYSTPRLAQMISEFDALQRQLRTVVKDQLVPVSTETSSTHPASKIFVIQDEDLAQSLGIKTGKYEIKQSVNKENSQQKPKKRVRKCHEGKRARPKTASSGDNEESGNMEVDDTILPSNGFEDLIDTQNLEFAVAPADQKCAAAMMQSDDLEGPVVKIAEFPGDISGSSVVASAADDVLLCYLAQTAQSYTDLLADSDGMEPSQSLGQSSMMNSAAATQSSTLTFPLTLTIDSSALDSCSTLQFS